MLVSGVAGAPIFADRHNAGAAFGRRLQQYAGRPDVLVLGLPPGGIPVAYEVAQAIGAPLENRTVMLEKALSAGGMGGVQ